MENNKIPEFGQCYKKHGQSLLEKYDIPIGHLSYEYIEQCKNGKELERIVRILRSGEEGVYPHLTQFAEDHLKIVKPQSQLLRRVTKVIPLQELQRDERREIVSDIDGWLKDMRLHEKDLLDERDCRCNEPIPRPDIRVIGDSKEKKTSTNDSGQRQKKTDGEVTKRIGSCDYRAWDRYDADTELAKLELQEERKTLNSKRFQRELQVKQADYCRGTVLQKSLLTGTELRRMAVREREKGNEAYRARDYSEALHFYEASIALENDVDVINNRAATYMKLGHHRKAILDLDQVLAAAPDNLKARLRRALARENLGERARAVEDYKVVLDRDRNNPVALRAIEKLREGSKPVRMSIEELPEPSLDSDDDLEAVEESASGSEKKPDQWDREPLRGGPLITELS